MSSVLLYCVLSHQVYKMPTCDPASGEKRRKALPQEKKLKITAHLQASISVLSVFKVGVDKL